jgi:hypothetical protein
MNTFVNAVRNQEARTQNGMKARKSTANPCVDLFFKIGAMRGKNIIPDFAAAYVEDQDLALRIAQWARDVRGGSGERKLFRDILTWLETNDPKNAAALAGKIPELGRWDDLLVFEKNMVLKKLAFSMIREAIQNANGLTAKWMPRKGPIANELRSFLGMSPKQYRKTLVNLTKVVEQQMCAQDWDNINFSHVPSVAHARYKKAFGRHTPKYGEYVQALVKGEKGVKVNAGAVYPYDVLKGRINLYSAIDWTKTELDLIQKQWEALPDYIGDKNVLPLVDVSGSMTCKAGGHCSKSNVSCLEVAVSLGLYCADKNTGKFKDCFLTFSSTPELLHLKGDINKKIDQMVKSSWSMSTNLHAAFEKILTTAVNGKVPQNEMPEMLLIFSDMQFNACTNYDDSAMEMIERKYKDAGYEIPKVVFWNLNANDNVPVSFNKHGTALVSGFSPAIMKALFSNNIESFTPEYIMRQAVCIPRYDYKDLPMEE